MLSLWALLALLLSLHLSQGLAASVLHHRADACNELLRGHFNSAIHSGSSVFAEDVIEPWSQTCQTTLTCVFAPASAEEVAGGLDIHRKTDQTFAVRAQGHNMPVPGAADISNGVLMVTTSLNSVQYADDSKSVVQIGAGNRWLDVYEVLAKDSLAVAGGRFLTGRSVWPSAWWCAEAVYLINQTFFDVIAANPQIKTTMDLSVTRKFLYGESGSRILPGNINQ
ncbi:hypothetical protein ACN38_g5046 [Penicillium nordicum]|uniref:FAD linked oxidase N-terminal domain-containing protein n=1 Tax=Penicillium nordicum TaxID=229535 RepID=A0A0M8P9K4_9EURO|nr:hypothetical protein ACN38_g5046 [Penicillium nordicum]